VQDDPGQKAEEPDREACTCIAFALRRNSSGKCEEQFPWTDKYRAVKPMVDFLFRHAGEPSLVPGDYQQLNR